MNKKYHTILSTRIIWVVLILGSLLLSACNLPFSQNSNQQTDSAIATSVQQTLIVNESRNTPIPLAPMDTSTPAASPTLPLTNTPTPSIVPTSTQTPTTTPQNWKTALGNPTKKDTLDNGNGFGLQTPYMDDQVTFSVSDGQLTAKSTSTNGWRSWRLRPPMIQNFYLEGKFKTVTCGASDQYGLVFRAPNYESGQGYYYAIGCDGTFSLSVWDANGSRILLPRTLSPAIRAGSGQDNIVGVMAKDNSFKLYANDQLLAEVNDSTIPGSGYYGIFIGGSSGSFSYQLDEIAYWLLP